MVSTAWTRLQQQSARPRDCCIPCVRQRAPAGADRSRHERISSEATAPPTGHDARAAIPERRGSRDQRAWSMAKSCSRAMTTMRIGWGRQPTRVLPDQARLCLTAIESGRPHDVGSRRDGRRGREVPTTDRRAAGRRRGRAHRGERRRAAGRARGRAIQAARRLHRSLHAQTAWGGSRAARGSWSTLDSPRRRRRRPTAPPLPNTPQARRHLVAFRDQVASTALRRDARPAGAPRVNGVRYEAAAVRRRESPR